MDVGLRGLGMANNVYFWYDLIIMTTLLNMVYNYSFAAYFIIASPASNGTQYANNAAYSISWEKGANDGIYGFDLEMTRMSKDGLYLIARNGAYID
jgi:hypothetical protein